MQQHSFWRISCRLKEVLSSTFDSENEKAAKSVAFDTLRKLEES